MRGKKFIDAMGYLDDRHLERYVGIEERLARRPRAVHRVRLAAIAACILLFFVSIPIISFGIMFGSGFGAGEGGPNQNVGADGVIFPPSSESVLSESVSAEEVAALFGDAKSDGTSSYTVVYAPSPELLWSGAGSSETRLPIYSYTQSTLPLDREALSAELGRFIGSISSELGGVFPEHELVESEGELGSYFVSSDGVLRVIASQNGGESELAVLSQSPSLVRVGDNPITIDPDANDASLLASLTSVRAELLRALGVSFDSSRVVRSYGGGAGRDVRRITVFYYDASAHPLNYLCETPVSDFVSIELDLERDSLCIRYRESRASAAREYTERARCKRIGLDAAEALLERGYVFGGHSCPLCMESQDAVDFSEYDRVGLVYIVGRDVSGRPTEALPFYVFYKRIGVAENGNHIYARTYVCALEVSGLDEYFAAQSSEH